MAGTSNLPLSICWTMRPAERCAAQPDDRHAVVLVLGDVELAALQQQAVALVDLAVAAAVRDLHAGAGIGGSTVNSSPAELLTMISTLPPLADSMPLALKPGP